MPMKMRKSSPLLQKPTSGVTKAIVRKPSIVAAAKAPVAPTFEIQSVDDMDENRAFLFYGRAGTGKTTIAGTFPAPVLVIDVNDRGTDSIKGTGASGIRIKEWEVFEAIYWDMIEHPDKYEKYKTIVVDTVTQLQTLAIEYILRKKKKDVSKAGDWGTMTKREWGDVSQLMKTWIINFRDLEKNVVFLAQDRVSKENDEDEEESIDGLLPEIGPSLSPAVAKTICAAVHVIGNTFIKRTVKVKEVAGKKIEKEETKYCLRIGPHPICLTKIRKPKDIDVPAIFVDPSYSDIMTIIQGE